MNSERPHISNTQEEMYFNCGEAYRRRYIDGEKIPPGIALLIGSGTHRGAEANFRQKIESELKILLLLGIGLFVENANVKYMEIMKKLAEQQRLFIIIASSDYIYGTNYQFCHGFIGKDLIQMTQQKTMQAMGRIGRNNIQQDYTIRFRDDNMISQLFRRPETNMEAKNMCNLWGGRVVV